MTLARAWQHLTREWGSTGRWFDAAAMARIADAIEASEATHGGEVVVAIESRLRWQDALRGVSARDRAEFAFAHLKVWDTEHNAGVLIHLLIAEHAIEVIADRGIAARVDAAVWQALVARIREGFARGDPAGGVIDAVTAASAALAAAVPPGTNNPDERPNRPARLG